MTITLYPTVIEAHDEAGAVFTLKTFDSDSATLECHAALMPDNVDEVLDAIRAGFEMLKLKAEEPG